MRSVIGYVGVEEGGNFIVPTVKIMKFARDNKLELEKVYTDVDSTQNNGDGSGRSEFKEVVELSLKMKWPIIATSADRFTRSGVFYRRFVAAGGRAYGARKGFGVDESVMPAAIVRAQVEGKPISGNTRREQARAKLNGVMLGVAAGPSEPSDSQDAPIIGPDNWITRSGLDRLRRLLVVKRIADAELRGKLYWVSNRRLTDEEAKRLTDKILEKEDEFRARAEAEEIRWGSF
jgi:hypothetical protein